MLTVTIPAPDPWLISIEQARVAAGLDVDDDSRDEELDRRRAAVSARIYEALNIAVANGGEPTLRRETLTQVCQTPSFGPVILKRRHNVEIVSVTGWASDYMLESEAGLLHRPGARRRHCGDGLTTIVYKAGFDEVPALLVEAALELFNAEESGGTRDPSVKREIVDIDGVERVEQEFFADGAATSSQTAVPPSILATLRRFRNSIYA